MTKTLTTLLLVPLMAISLFAGTVNFAWNAASDPSISTLKVWGVQGTNTVFTAGNANATVTQTTPASNTTLSISNLVAGQYTFTATYTSTNNIQSTNCPSVTFFVPLAGVVNVRVTSVTTP